jgi:small-conductance mechanosensitive channel
MEAMLMRSEAMEAEIARVLADVRSALHDVRVATQRTAAEHEQMAAWYADHGDEGAAWTERRTATAQRQRLADLDAALDALEDAVSAALDLDP